MVMTGLEILAENLPAGLRGKRIGILCHASSITRDYSHITDIFFNTNECSLSAIFGPQHGIYGQTQDNMIEWQSHLHPIFNVPLFSLYGEYRKPVPEMISEPGSILTSGQ
jgi:uncharacterized protein YbbC (DUF1343 family)